MTSERDFDRLARAWLELGPDEAPDRVVAAVLQAAETMPQVRRRVAWPTWRPFQMNRLLLFAGAAVLLVAVIGGGALIGGRASVAVSVTPSPTVVPSPSAASSAAATTPVPAELRSIWVAAPRTVPGFSASYRYRFELTEDSFRFPFDDLRDAQLPAQLPRSSTATSSDSTSVDTSDGCQVGDVGTYTWSPSSSGTRLTVTMAERRLCAVRRSALPGDWQRVGCKDTDSGCFGDLVDAGTYQSQYFTPTTRGRSVVGAAVGRADLHGPGRLGELSRLAEQLRPDPVGRLREPKAQPDTLTGPSARSGRTGCPTRSARTRLHRSGRPRGRRPASMASSPTSGA